MVFAPSPDIETFALLIRPQREKTLCGRRNAVAASETREAFSQERAKVEDKRLILRSEGSTFSEESLILDKLRLRARWMAFSR